MEDDSALIINILELLKQVEFFDTKESCDSEECGEWDGDISRNYLDKFLSEQSSAVVLVKEKFLANFAGSASWMIQKQL